MAHDRTDAPPKLALVLGGGGQVGLAYHAGVLLSLEHHLGFDARDADVVVGTSAGSLVGALLRRGLGAEELAAFVVGAPFRDEWVFAEQPLRLAASQRPRPRLRNLVTPPPPRQLLRAVWGAHRRPPLALIAGMLNGAVDIEQAVSVLDRLGEGWPARPLRVVAVARDGRRVVFGERERTPPLASAVAASCAIPGVFAPVRIGSRSYIDGGVHSPTNADVVRDLRPEHVLVVSPMSSPPHAASRRLDAPVRRRARIQLAREVGLLRAAGTRVTVVEPRADELSVMSLNLMRTAGTVSVLREAFLATGDRVLRGEIDLGTARSRDAAGRSRG